ncbi:hypothetical protein PG2001B_0158 [Bifidobacterium pseudolongum subsp. globosum]|uniref:DUF262 domain-containing protein n=1 Tax=Bifidobacterium pseudolongum subsp. globosum TaxID=1690 RepID=A0A4Q5AWL7_9BIFI|nr:DUF262 domain-containing protein [Bifidobacterium pseudolongum]RYQ20923.1 hypothetical protein PG2071B_0093 [Bifidobacterium pseudolongum subsp. globosum]RYQ40277.1 hypothetical protein PG2001B_0158 [Bifidobacterium pseudolongum subsp. globosum]
MTGKPAVLSIAELFGEGCVYRVPIYQRAYAWDTDEIETLLDDIRRAISHDTQYYLGSLVVARRDSERNEAVYEVIDGQQRLTTLYLLMAVLRHGNDDNAWNMQLEYECRAESYGALLEQLRASGEPDQPEDSGVGVQDGPSDQEKQEKREEMEMMRRPLIKGYQCIRQYLEKPGQQINPEKLRTNVRIIRDELPSGTDLNRYFEIMNTRGVQLRPQDVIKARLMSSVASSPADCETIGRIWDVCSDMGRYMQCLATPDERTRWFGEDWSSVPPDDWNRLVGETAPDNNGSYDGSVKSFKKVLHEALNNEPTQAEQQTQTGVQSDDEAERHRSIISFPSFLMHVLRIYSDGKSDTPDDDQKVPLDDAELLRVFDDKVVEIYSEASRGSESSEGSETSGDGNSAENNAKRFAATLLQCRFLFDNYIIKTHIDSAAPSDAAEWTLKCYKGNRKERSYYLANTFSDEVQQQELIMIQSMFQVTEAGNNYKNALYAMLQWLWNAKTIDGSVFLQVIREYARGRLEGELRSKDLKNAPTDGCQSHIPKAVNRGVGTERFIFNYLDYALWELLTHTDDSSQEEDGSTASIFGTDERPAVASDVCTRWKEYASQTARPDGGTQTLDCRQFRFRYRNSVEHFSPQHPLGGGDAPGNVNDFGNLCLLTVRENSRRNNLDAMEKIRHFNVAQQSLKFQFMVGQAQKENTWGERQINEQTELWIRLLDALSNVSYVQ